MSGSSSIWGIDAATKLADTVMPSSSLHKVTRGVYEFNVHHFNNSIWITAAIPGKGKIAFRTAYVPDGLTIESIENTAGGIQMLAVAAVGTCKVRIDLPEQAGPLLHYTVSFTAKDDPRLSCRMKIIMQERTRLPDITVTIDDQHVAEIPAEAVSPEYLLNGGQNICVTWNNFKKLQHEYTEYLGDNQRGE